jgi:hypothetical protein
MKFSRNVVVVEVEVSTQFGIEFAVNVIRNILCNLSVPAVRSLKVLSAKTNYELHKDPSDKLQEVPVQSNWNFIRATEEENEKG